MQIILFLVVVVGLIIFLIYTINKKFGMKELFILIAVLVIPAIGTSFLLKSISQKVPDIFKEKYQEEKKVQISKFSYERQNNKNVSSNSNFIYNFDFIIIKDNKEFICSVKNLNIKKIEDEYVFENFKDIKDECVSK